MAKNFTMMKKDYKKLENQKGSILIIVVVITSILFGVGIALVNILEKEILRQAYTERSQIAINVANSALECVLFNEFRRSLFSSEGRSLDCGPFYQIKKIVDDANWSNYIVDDISTSSVTGVDEYKFQVIQSFKSTPSNTPCAVVTLKKECNDGETTTGRCKIPITNQIEILGYDRCKNADSSNRDIVRRIRIFY